MNDPREKGRRVRDAVLSAVIFAVVAFGGNGAGSHAADFAATSVMPVSASSGVLPRVQEANPLAWIAVATFGCAVGTGIGNAVNYLAG